MTEPPARTANRAGTGVRAGDDEPLDDSLRAILEAAGLGWWDMDLVTGETVRSLRHDQLFGHTEKLPSWGYEDFISSVHPEDRARVAASYEAALAGGEEYSVDLRVVWSDSSEHWVFTRGRVLLAEDGTPRRISGVMGDITERKRAELASLEELSRAAALIESTGDAVVGLGLDGTVRSWNRAAELLYGRTEVEAVGTPVSLLWPAGDLGLWAPLAEAARGRTTADRETLHRHRDGSTLEVSLTVSPVLRGTQVTGISLIARDIGVRQVLQRRLSHQALHDELTGLPNRALLADRLSHALAVAVRDGEPVSVLFLDLDEFKLVNDAAGHLVGDTMLVEVARRLTAAVRPEDTLARFGGDEFVVVCTGAGLEQVESLAVRLHAALQTPVEIDGGRMYVGVSIGVSHHRGGADAAVDAGDLGDLGEQLIREADTAMYDAKVRGRGRTSVFDEPMASRVRDRLELTADLREALESGQLELHYQPVVQLATGRVTGVEALARWDHPARGQVPPGVFVCRAEEAGLVTALDRWALRRACRDAEVLRSTGALSVDARMAVNISALDLSGGLLADMVVEAGAGHDLGLLIVEVTETAVLADPDSAAAELAAVRALGVVVAIDDFGTGQASLANLRRLPVTVLKIDQGFVAHVVDSADDRAIVASVISLAHAIGLYAVAEGVETEAQLAVLLELGCDFGQGYLWAPAMSLPDLLTTMLGVPEQRLPARPRVPAGRR